MAQRAFGAPRVKSTLRQLPTRFLGVMPLQDPVIVAPALIDGAERKSFSIFFPPIVRLTCLLRGFYYIFDSHFARRIGYVMQSERSSPDRVEDKK
jgi:hypothetical protein